MKKILLVILCILLSSCRQPPADLKQTIEFTKVPPATEGGPDKIETIEGRVTNARPGQQIVLFAKSGGWWVQPYSTQPFTEIQPDSKWKNFTHLGIEYAALLVEPGYRPPAKTDLLPTVGDLVVAVATTNGEEIAPVVSQTLQFSGYEWKIRSVISDRGATQNLFDPANAWTDEKGFLHLRIAQRSGQWTCAEVSLTRSLGYGSYLFKVHDVSHLEPAAVLSIFTWDDLEANQNHREMDIDVTRWGDPANKNVQYVVQPYYVPANVVQFTLPSGELTHSFRWEPGRVDFKSARGAGIDNRSQTVAEHEFTSGVPSPEGESVHLSLYVFGYAKVPLQKETEIVIEKFEYLP